MTEPKQKLYATTRIWKRSLLYVLFLFVFACALTYYCYINQLSTIVVVDWWVYLFFFLFAIFTDFKGFPHPNYGYVSFDRVVQVSSILVLGPLPAVLINGLASFLFPLLSNYLGGNKRAVSVAVFNNSAMLMLMLLLGVMYEQLGGDVPLLALDALQFLLLCLLLICIQVTNSSLMRILMKVREQKIKRYFSWFSTKVEIFSGLAGICYALVFNRLDFAIVALFTAVSVVVMLVINQFALMRSQLEKQVNIRTKELKDKTQELEYLAMHDELTSLVNRRFINRHIKSLLQDQNIDNKGIFIAFADIDDFKKINDQYSHEYGDVVLQRIGKILQQFCTEMLIIARYGGEEFLLCFQSMSKAEAIKTCEEIRKEIFHLNFYCDDKRFNVTISLGITNAHHHSIHKNLICHADENLYKAKKNGKNQTIIH